MCVSRRERRRYVSGRSSKADSKGAIEAEWRMKRRLTGTGSGDCQHRYLLSIFQTIIHYKCSNSLRQRPRQPRASFSSSSRESCRRAMRRCCHYLRPAAWAATRWCRAPPLRSCCVEGRASLSRRRRSSLSFTIPQNFLQQPKVLGPAQGPRLERTHYRSGRKLPRASVR